MKAGIHRALKFMVAGQLTLILGILCSLLNRYFIDHSSLLDFLSGAFLGMSMVLNLTFLARYGRTCREDG